jgi:hypothetical protein
MDPCSQEPATYLYPVSVESNPDNVSIRSILISYYPRSPQGEATTDSKIPVPTGHRLWVKFITWKFVTMESDFWSSSLGFMICSNSSRSRSKWLMNIVNGNRLFVLQSSLLDLLKMGKVMNELSNVTISKPWNCSLTHRFRGKCYRFR